LALWTNALVECRQRDDINVVILTGAGQAFCSGGDIKDMVDRLDEGGAPAQKAFLDEVHEVAWAMERLDKPVICAINGAATGAGLDMALMCDLRFCSDQAKLASTYAKVGLVPGDGGAFFLPRLIGLAKALELMWTGDWVSAEEAERIGLVNRIVPHDALIPTVYEFAQRLAEGPSVALRLIKRATYEGLRSDLTTHLDMMSSHYAVAAGTEDHKNAVAAFVNKERPIFQGK
ncbi:enoyl-CoA hydratase/isomerase family protein, partial [Chloroflexi bacterium TSY]|nr:enoyl-CoA hydratase/isomerase family protein [Chloroflexi bacterium TSY]